MNFLEAVKKMKEGKKVRRPGWCNEGYAESSKGDYEFGNIGYKEFALEGDRLRIQDIEATDWEIVEEKEEDRNPAHFCLGCNKFLGFRGFCSQKCHDKWYDEAYPEEEKKTLSDEMHTITCYQNGFRLDGELQKGTHTFIRWIDSSDVKEAINEFIGTLFFERTEEQIKEKAKEIFGERLIK